MQNDSWELRLKYTRGPWKADKNAGCKRISAKVYGQHKQAKRSEIAHTVGLSDESEDAANARLLAEAPKLYQALQELVWTCEAMEITDEIDAGLDGDGAYENAVKVLKAAADQPSGEAICGR
jgi:hypothetical protein